MFRLLQMKTCAAYGALAILAASASLAGALEPVSFPPPPPTAAFTIVDGGREIAVDVAQIEKLGVYRLATTTPWDQGTVTFEGVMLGDVLKMAGLDGAKAVRVHASDDYSSLIPREDWAQSRAMLATRQDGKLLDPKDKGPTRLVYSLSEHPEYGSEERQSRWVWLIDRIERAD